MNVRVVLEDVSEFRKRGVVLIALVEAFFLPRK